MKQLASDVYLEKVQAELTKLTTGDDDKIDLLAAALWIAALDNEELDVEDYRHEIDELGADLQKSLPENADDAAKLAALRKFFFEELGFHGGRLSYYARSNNHLNEVIDDREGMPITLSILYIELGQRIGLNLVGVGLPGHFVVRHEPKEGDSQLIDVFDGGEPLSRKKAEEQVFQNTGRPARDEHFASAKRSDILTRVLSNLLRRAQDEKDVEAMYRYVDTILTLDANSADYRALRFELCAFSKRTEQARADAEWLLDKRPEGVNLQRVETLKEQLK